MRSPVVSRYFLFRVVQNKKAAAWDALARTPQDSGIAVSPTMNFERVDSAY
jgi:hypothetical protein